MKKLIFATLAAAALVPMVAKAQDEPTDSVVGFKFTDKVMIKDTPVKDQNKSGTCWAFSGISFLEDEILRAGGPELDLSEMFIVRHCYEDKADKYVRMDGTINFAQGGATADVLYVLDRYGIVPEEVYAGLNYGEKKHSHYEMAGGLQGFLDGARKGSKTMTTAWKPAFNAILDAYLGELPETFTYNGKTYTPQSYAKSLGLNTDDYISITSFTHHPFYKEFPLEVADNWLWATSMNVPMEDMEAIVDNALNNGYPVCWGADVSENGFKWVEGYAVIPAELNQEDMEGSELARWVKLSDKDREKERFNIKGPGKEKVVTQETRQQGFDSKETTDDHGMVIVGIAEDQEGNKFYKVKNSWDTNQIYDGYFYMSVPYFLEKTMSFVVNKNAIPKDIAKKMGLKK